MYGAAPAGILLAAAAACIVAMPRRPALAPRARLELSPARAPPLASSAVLNARALHIIAMVASASALLRDIHETARPKQRGLG